MGYVYKYVLHGEIIYIGKSNTELGNRFYQHGRCGDNIDAKYRDEINQSDIYYMEFEDGYVTDMVETILINRYKPKCNKAKIISDTIPVIFNEWQHCWKVFRILHQEQKECVSQEIYNDLLEKYETLQKENDYLKSRLSIIDEYTKAVSKIQSLAHDFDMYKKRKQYKSQSYQKAAKIFNKWLDSFANFYNIWFEDFIFDNKM